MCMKLSVEDLNPIPCPPYPTKHLYLCVKSFLQIVQVLSLVQTLYQHVIYIEFYIPSNLWMKHMVNQPLVCCPCVFQTEGHHFVTKQALTGDEWRLLSVCLVHPYLIVSGENIHKTKQLVTHSRIYQLVNARQRIAILGVSLV